MTPRQKYKIDQNCYDRNKDIADNNDHTDKEYLYQKPKKDQIKNYRSHKDNNQSNHHSEYTK